ncbi:MAG: phosphotransferase [Caldilineaceae bacterium]|nr:phosphotransferase [Caldilineaceae bacterium]
MDIQSLDIQSLLADAVGPAYGMANFVLHPLIQEDERQLYRIDRTGAAPWLLRTYAYPQSAKRQEQHASVLKLLETQGYPAPRLIPTKNGEYVAEHTVGETAWHFVVTTFIEGNVIEGDAPTALRKMGEVLGHFHRFSQSLPVIETQNLSPALWRPETMIPLVQLQLADIQQIVPATNQSSYEQIQRAVDAIPSFHHLPSALNHGDCVPTNAVSMADETIVLIDWADAGLGVLLLDLSWLLLMGMGSIPDGSATSIATSDQIEPPPHQFGPTQRQHADSTAHHAKPGHWLQGAESRQGKILRKMGGVQPVKAAQAEANDNANQQNNEQNRTYPHELDALLQRQQHGPTNAPILTLGRLKTALAHDPQQDDGQRYMISGATMGRLAPLLTSSAARQRRPAC